jgi:hypothetical protein
MRREPAGALTGQLLTLSLRPSWLLALTYASFVAGCFLFAMGTTGSRHGHDTSIGCIRMTENGTTPLTAFALIQKAREACS